jgi:hypothetical protein
VCLTEDVDEDPVDDDRDSPPADEGRIVLFECGIRKAEFAVGGVRDGIGLREVRIAVAIVAVPIPVVSLFTVSPTVKSH